MLRLQTWITVLTVGLMIGAATPALADWALALPDTVIVSGSVTRVRNLTSAALPSQAAEVVVHAGGTPGTLIGLNRRLILRKLVNAGLAHGVRFTGAEETTVIYAGSRLDEMVLRQEIRRTLQPLVPGGMPGAPASWFEFDLPQQDLWGTGDLSVSTSRSTELAPGRNPVRIRVTSGGQSSDFTVAVTLHHYGETATANRPLARGMTLTPDLFTWQWVDLSEADRDHVSSRLSLMGNSVARSLRLGDPLRQSDLKMSPVVQAGDQVELLVRRGPLVVSTKAFARQDGCLGQTIPVRNDLTGRLVNARVSGPGQVEWRN